MKQYMLSIVYPANSTAPAPEALQQIMQDVGALTADMKAKGAWVFGAGLHPASTATMVHVKGSEVLVTDGPFAETREQIGGITVIRAEDLDQALSWGKRLSKAVGCPVEVRPMQAHA